jgi:hypothetical protein
MKNKGKKQNRNKRKQKGIKKMRNKKGKKEDEK